MLGIPFYLADPKLRTLEKAVDALESERQIMMYMRHEAGHVFNYAYRLYTTPEWRRLFGPFFRAYRDDYRPVPFSRNYVRHIEGWYAQKHPDEDFAETFAVWLTPRSRPGGASTRAGRRCRSCATSSGWRARVADVEPIVKTGEVDITPDDIGVTVEQFYEQAAQERQARIDIALDAHLGQIFLTRRRKESQPAADIVSRYTRGAGREDHLLDRRAAADRPRTDRFDLPDLRADEAVGRGRRGGAVPGGSHGAGDDAGDEFSDARADSTLTPGEAEPYSMGKLKIVVLYDRVLVDETESRRRPPTRRR